MNDLARKDAQLPAVVKELARKVAVGTERYRAEMAGIRAMKKADIAEPTRRVAIQKVIDDLEQAWRMHAQLGRIIGPAEDAERGRGKSSPYGGFLGEKDRAYARGMAEAEDRGFVDKELEAARKKCITPRYLQPYADLKDHPMDGDEWYTPRWLFDALGLEFEIDVCGPEDREHVATPTKRFFTEKDDGIAQEWAGMVWCNPPYSTPEPWALKMIEHGDGLLLVHMPMNAEWCVKVWEACSGIRLFQAMEFVRPDGTLQRPGYWLQLAAFGDVAAKALADMTVPDDVAENPRRVPSPMWVRG